MPDYLVEYTGNVREVYSITAENVDEARERAIYGKLVISESSSMEFYSVQEDD